jgi:hypothetical protein
MTVLIFFRNQLKHLAELDKSLRRRRHKRVAPRNRWYFGHPSLRLVAKQHDLIVVKSHAVIVPPRVLAKNATKSTALAQMNLIDRVSRMYE